MAVDSKIKMVVDASAILCVLLGDENRPQKIELALKDYAADKLDLVAPVLLKTEIGNALRSAFLQKRLTSGTARELYQKFLELPIEYVESLDLSKILELSLKQDLSFYDATYLHLANCLDIKLLTLDKKLNQKHQALK